MKQQRTSAFSLVELTLALGVASFCLVTLFGLIPIAVQTNRNATSQTAATGILSSVVADIRTTAKVTPSATPSQLYVIAIPASGASNPATQTRYFDGQGRCSCDSAGLQQPNPLTGNCSLVWSPALQLRYRVSVTFPQNQDPGPNTYKATYANLKVTWPAPADPATTTPSGSVQMFAGFDRN